MINSPRKKLIEQFDSQIDVFQSYTQGMEQLIGKILSGEGLHIHSISSRVKRRESLEKKIALKEDKYGSLNEITDVCAVRIITFFENDVDLVAQLIESEFVIDKDNSVDKRKILNPDQFGYLSVHYVLELNGARKALPEYQRYPDFPFELQIRSILQHAWAEIEHDIGYKTESSVPIEMRRRFSRLAGLLELADEEFSEIRTELENYEKNVAGKIADNPSIVEINKASIKAFMRSSVAMRRIDASLAAMVKAKLAFDENLIDFIVNRCSYFNLKNVQELENALVEKEGLINRFAREWLTGTLDQLWEGISTFYLSYVLLAEQGNQAEIRRYIDEFNIGTADEREELAQKIVETYARITSS